jgi:hypothetical protein
MISAMAMGIRTVAGSVVIPFGIAILFQMEKNGRWKRLAALAIPMVLMLLANLIYNNRVWGSPFRSSHNATAPVPFDYPWLAFSPQYLGANFKTLLQPETGWLLAALAALMFLRRAAAVPITPNIRSTLEFILWAVIPVTALHLVFFAQEPRYFLPVMVFLAVLTGGLAGHWLARVDERAAVMTAFVTGVAAVFFLRPMAGAPLVRMTADKIAAETPDNAIILSNIDVGRMEFYAVKNSQRRIIPLSRKVEYAFNLIAYRRVPNPDPPPRAWWDHYCAGLIKGGARPLVPFTADERPDWIIDEVNKGTPVFLEFTEIDETNTPLLNRLAAACRFISQPKNPLVRLTPKTAQKHS